jgi:hypothetical protein
MNRHLKLAGKIGLGIVGYIAGIKLMGKGVEYAVKAIIEHGEEGSDKEQIQEEIQEETVAELKEAN